MFSQSNQGNPIKKADEPSWSSYPVKRVIPNHITSKRKPGFQVSTGKKEKTKDINPATNSFNTISFGSPRKPGTAIDSRKSNASNLFDTTADVTKFDETINKTVTDEFSLYDTMDEDLPPSRSLFDFNDEILLDLDKPNNHNESFINKDPKSYSNVFNKTGISNESKSKKEPLNPLEHGESAILVYGYPEHMANQIIQYFQKFGTILEDFQTKGFKTGKPKEKMIPCFTGNSWVKITYDNPASALEALLHNGMVFNGSLIGVQPYTKDTIEKLQNRKLGDAEDIGSGIEFKSMTYENQEPVDNTDLNNTTSSRSEIKDGSKIFLTKDNNKIDTKNNNENLGIFGNIMKHVFGFNEL